MNRIQKYITELQQVLDLLPIELIDQVIQELNIARLNGKQIFTMGNGGSASTASHFVCDLSKNTYQKGIPPFAVIGLSENIASITAYANDEGYENVFANQLANLIRVGDIVIGISTSGNSPNVIHAIELAKQVGARTIGFTGFKGGRLGALVDINLCVPSDCIEQVEDVHLMLEHLICKALREDALKMVTSPRLLCSVTQEIALELDLRDLLRRILQLTLNGMGAASGSIMVVNSKGEVVEGALLYAGKLQADNPQHFSEIVERGLAGWVVENRQPALVENTKEDPRWLRRSWDEKDNKSRSAISVPLMNNNRVIGVLTLVHAQAGKFTKNDLILLTAITVSISLVNYKVE